MTENQNCVFIPPSFDTTELLGILCAPDPAPATAPPLRVAFGDVVTELAGEIRGARVLWRAEGEFQLAGASRALRIIEGSGRELDFRLDDLLFLNPSESCALPPNVYALRFQSGLYVRRCDFGGDSVTFSASSLLTLDYENVERLQAKLSELQSVTRELSATKDRLRDAGIDLDKLASLKAQIQEALREKRVAQYRLTQENQKISAVTVHSKNEVEYNASLEALRGHIEANRRAAQEQEQRAPLAVERQKLLRFRMVALDELKMIFPFDAESGAICGSVHFCSSPMQPQQWDETRAFLGFATHYIREVANVIGIPLPYSLTPMTTASRITCRLTGEVRQIPQTEDSRTLAAYVGGLIDCIKHILDVLDVVYEEQLSLIKAIKYLYTLTEENVKTLIPSQ